MRSPCGSPPCWLSRRGPACGLLGAAELRLALTGVHPQPPSSAVVCPESAALCAGWSQLQLLLGLPGAGRHVGVHQPCSVRAARPCKTKLSEEQELVRASLHHAARSVRFPGPRSCCHSLVDLAQPRSTWLPGCALQPARPGGGDEQGDVGTACCELLAADCSS